jgi:cytosine permease
MSSTSDIPVAGTGPGNTAPDAAATFDEYEDRPVPASARKSLFAVSSVWLGFPMILTCAVFGGMIVYSLGFWPGMAAIAVGNLILMAYVGLLSYQAGRTGENFALMAARTFGAKGYRIPAAFLTTVVIGWFAFQTGLTGSTLEASMGGTPQ